MEVLAGFVIALAISLTGVGAGSITTPLLILLFGVSPSVAVGTALAFGAIVKLIAAPVYFIRGHVDVRVLMLLFLGGAPGVIVGGLLLNYLKHTSWQQTLYTLIGALIVLTASFQLYRVFWPARRSIKKDQARLLPWLAFPIAAEVGFSSAGAGALGSLVLLGLTPLAAATVIGTDLCFGLGVSLLGSAIQFGAGNSNPSLLLKLAAGGIAGAICGSLLSGKFAQRPLRIALLLALIVLGVQLAIPKSSAQPSDKTHASAMLIRHKITSSAVSDDQDFFPPDVPVGLRMTQPIQRWLIPLEIQAL